MHQNPYQPPSSPAQFQNVPTSAGFYEFNSMENMTISKLAGRVRWWGMFSVTIGGLALLGLVGGGLTIGAAAMTQDGAVGGLIMAGTLVVAIPLILIYIVTGSLYLGSGRALNSVVHTQGNDVEHMLQALQKMGKAFRIEFWITLLAYIVMIVGIAVIAAFAVALDAA
jgi:uncharacterized membrane protein YhaH (DUF805 family)